MSSLRLFLDTAEPATWQRWLPVGLFHGVTTNPTLLKSAGLPCSTATLAKLADEARALGARELHAQAWGGSAASYFESGRELARLGPDIVVKLPATEAGVRAGRELVLEGVPITLTALYAAPQAIVAAALGADYAAPYLGRLGDAGRDGYGTIRRMAAVVRALGARTRILVASIRSVEDLALLAADGLDTFTVSPKVAEDLFSDPLTTEAARLFELHAEGAGGIRLDASS